MSAPSCGVEKDEWWQQHAVFAVTKLRKLSLKVKPRLQPALRHAGDYGPLAELGAKDGGVDDQLRQRGQQLPVSAAR